MGKLSLYTWWTRLVRYYGEGVEDIHGDQVVHGLEEASPSKILLDEI
jgi:hypothetical protein